MSALMDIAVSISMNMPKILLHLVVERQRQYRKWGRQKHSNETWQTIALEEFGEIAKAMLENKTKRPSEEIIQTAAVLIAWAEDIDERGEFPSEEYGGFNDEAQKAAKEAKSS